MAAPTTPISILVTQLVQPLFYGILVVSFGFCLHVLLRTDGRWKSSTEINKTLLGVTCSMFLVATLDVLVFFAMCINAAQHPDTAYEGWMAIIGVIDVIVLTIIGDTMLIHRCFTIYGRNWKVIAAPLVLAVAGLVCVALSVYYLITLPEGSTFASPYRELVISTWSITIAINILTTSLIVYRIWHAGEKRQYYHHAMRVIIESGLLYTTCATATAVSYIAGSNAFTPLSAVDAVMIGISFNLIIIRVTRRRKLRLEAPVAPMSSMKFSFDGVATAASVGPASPTTHSGTLRGSDRGRSDEDLTKAGMDRSKYDV